MNDLPLRGTRKIIQQLSLYKSSYYDTWMQDTHEKQDIKVHGNM